MKRKGAKELIASGIILLLTGGMMLLFSSFSESIYPLYQIFSKKWLALLADVFSFTEVALWDYLFLVGITVFIFLFVRSLFVKKGTGILICRTVLIVCILISVMVCGFMLNHYGPSLAQQIGLLKGEYTKEQLYDATAYYFDEAQRLAEQLSQNSNTRISEDDFEELAIICGEAYSELAEQYPVFEGSTKPVKEISLLGDYLLYNGIVGMFMPITGESGVPRNDYPIALPFNMCHEAAHRLSIANEEDCNFAAYLACASSEDIRLQYSGAYMAFRYCFNALYKADSDMAMQLIEQCHNTENYNQVIEDYNNHSSHYEAYESSLSDLSDSLNDAYLKTFSNEEGTLSYGKVCDDLVCCYLQNAYITD